MSPLDRYIANHFDRPNYQEATVALVDALRDYLFAEQDLREDLALQGSLTRKQYRRMTADMQPYRLILKELETYNVNPTLDGLLPCCASSSTKP